jgi:hypothetical protein
VPGRTGSDTPRRWRKSRLVSVEGGMADGAEGRGKGSGAGVNAV